MSKVEVSEAQMRALFGRGMHPDAERLLRERTALYLAAGETPARAAVAAERDVRLGRRFPTFASTSPSWSDLQKTAYQDHATLAWLGSPTRRGEAWAATGLVFTQDDGSMVAPGKITQAFTQVVRRSVLPRIRLYDLKHTHANLALAAGVDIKVVSDRLGHSTTSITSNLYTHITSAVARQAADAIAATIPVSLVHDVSALLARTGLPKADESAHGDVFDGGLPGQTAPCCCSSRLGCSIAGPRVRCVLSNYLRVPAGRWRTAASRHPLSGRVTTFFASSPPLALKDGEKELASPRALEEDVLEEVRLLPHAHLLQQGSCRRIERVGHGEHPVQPEGAEAEIEQPSQGFPAETSALMSRGEREAHLHHPWFALADLGGEIAHKIAARMLLQGKLVPLPGRTQSAPFQRGQKRASILKGVVTPALEARDLRVSPIGHKRPEIPRNHRPSTQPGSLEDRLRGRHGREPIARKFDT